MKRIVIVGAAVAGVHAAEALRDHGFDGHLALISAENALPYDRPPLSKAALAGKTADPELLLRPSGWYAEHGIELIRGRPAQRLDPVDRSLQLADSTTLTYDGLILATGSTARRLDWISGDLDRIHTLRGLHDCHRLHERLRPGARLLVIGAGFIGLEVAATARELGAEVTLVEIGPAPLAMVLGAQVGAWFRRLHERHGVSVRCGRTVQAVEANGDSSRVYLDDGDVIDADTVVAGVGAIPATGWLKDSGIDMHDGAVICDGHLRASAPGVVAAGDIASWRHELFRERIRVAHWTNAVEQGRYAASSLLGCEGSPYAGLPYFWTDQFDAAARTVGRVVGGNRTAILHSDDASLVAIYGQGDSINGAICVNSPRALIGCRRMITQQLPWAEAMVAVKALTPSS